MINALEIQGKQLQDAVVTCLGAGAAAIACMRLLVNMGARRENIYMLDRRGVIYAGREGVNAYKQEFANRTDKRSLSDAVNGADVFIGLSGANLLSREMLLSMADRPIVFACSNPDPEIKPELALATRDDLIIATGRSDYPNQVNNVLGFPFIFRGALDVQASRINEEMKIAAVRALSELAREEVPGDVLAACDVDSLVYGPDYIIPKPVDQRLLSRIAPAVARAAVESGVARSPLPDNYAPVV
jgi:malate dehydrogenase (oxaloacetate-decarboxylating)(NADP+)